jgi:hypothetical protein
VTERAGRGRRPKATVFRGKWRIIDTELWDVDALDLMEPAHITFDAGNLGELQLIAIGAAIDYRVSERDGMPFVEFSWSGYDDADRASGRGWGRIEPGGALKGKLFIHQGDESAFTASPEGQRPGPSLSRGKPNLPLQPSRRPRR